MRPRCSILTGCPALGEGNFRGKTREKHHKCEFAGKHRFWAGNLGQEGIISASFLGLKTMLFDVYFAQILSFGPPSQKEVDVRLLVAPQVRVGRDNLPL